MSLSTDLISQFVKATKDDDVKEEPMIYGTIVKNSNSYYVKIDGSEVLTPISTTTDVVNGDRVTVEIKNHIVTVTGNLSSPAARNESVQAVDKKVTEVKSLMAYEVTATDLEAVNANIENLLAKVAKFDQMSAVSADIETLRAKFADLKYVSADEMKVINAYIENLQAEFGKFTDVSTDDLEAINADIENLKAYTADFTYVSTDVLKAMKAEIKNLDVKYATVDFANIKEAAMEHFYAQSGLIQNVTIGDGTITGDLVGVTISGDLIKGNTIVADKLVVKGEDGLYYKLNMSGETVEKEQTEYNSLNGDVIIAKSITASKVNVKDLVAFGATIGGFHITENSIYSGVKESVENGTSGLHLSSDGQMVIGDSLNFIKFFKDENGKYRLNVAADSITFGASGTSVEKAFTDVQDDILAWCYKNDKTYINGSKIYAGTITARQIATDALKSINYEPDKDGSFLNLADGSFDSKYLKWDKEGVLTATRGTIGGIRITEDGLYGGDTIDSIVAGDFTYNSGYSITKSGEMELHKAGSGINYYLYLDADSLKILSEGTTSGTDRQEINVLPYQINFIHLATCIGKLGYGAKNPMTLWGNSQVNISIGGNGIENGTPIVKVSNNKVEIQGTAHVTSGLFVDNGCLELSGSTPYIDFHFGKSTADYTSRIIEDQKGRLQVKAKLQVGGGGVIVQGTTIELSLGAGESATYSQLANAVFCIVQTHGNNYASGTVICDGRFVFIKTCTSDYKGFFVRITSDGSVITSTYYYDNSSKIVKIIPFFNKG